MALRGWIRACVITVLEMFTLPLCSRRILLRRHMSSCSVLYTLSTHRRWCRGGYAAELTWSVRFQVYEWMGEDTADFDIAYLYRVCYGDNPDLPSFPVQDMLSEQHMRSLWWPLLVSRNHGCCIHG